MIIKDLIIEKQGKLIAGLEKQIDIQKKIIEVTDEVIELYEKMDKHSQWAILIFSLSAFIIGLLSGINWR